MQESEWIAATEEIRRVFAQRMRSSDSFELVDVLLPVGRTGVEVLLGVDESHIASEQRDAMYTLHDAMTSRADPTYQVVGVFVSAEEVPSPVLARALGRMAPVDGLDGSVVPLTLDQAHRIAAEDSDMFEVLEPMFELAGVAASRAEADHVNAAGELLAEIAILVDRYDPSP